MDENDLFELEGAIAEEIREALSRLANPTEPRPAWEESMRLAEEIQPPSTILRAAAAAAAAVIMAFERGWRMAEPIDDEA
jgi:hypothetical protein